MFKDFSRKYISSFAKVAFCILAACLTLKLIAAGAAPFADFFNRYVAFVPRAVLSYITSVLPFSLAEAVLVSAIPIAAIYLVYCAVVVARRGRLLRHIFNLLGVICITLSLFFVNFGIAYDCTPIEKKLDMETGNLTVEDVFEASKIALGEIKELEAELLRDESGAAVSPYSYSEMNSRLVDEYQRMCGEYSFISPLSVGTKRVALSVPMRYTGIVGVYTFFTGEANVNTCGADYAVAFTAAHEMAHQRGIAPEDEANFVAFLTLYTSNDSYLKYCGLMEVFNYMANAVYREDEELYYELLTSFSEGVLKEYITEQEADAKFRDNIAEDVSGAVNDAYLKLQGQSEGTKSYGLVTDLATAYFLNKN